MDLIRGTKGVSALEASPTLTPFPASPDFPLRGKRGAVAALFALAASPAFSATGADVFNDKCGDCHTLDPSPIATAPPLKGVVGRKIASIAGFGYSAALEAKSGVWSVADLDAFLANPQGFAPGTTMFGGAPDPADRKAIIDYLTTAK